SAVLCARRPAKSSVDLKDVKKPSGPGWLGFLSFFVCFMRLIAAPNPCPAPLKLPASSPLRSQNPGPQTHPKTRPDGRHRTPGTPIEASERVFEPASACVDLRQSAIL